MAEPCEILERREVGPDVLWLRLAKPEGFGFAPGQRVKLGLGDEKKRPYSMASAPSDPYLEFCIERVEGGRLTPSLWRLRPGERLTLKPRAKGKLCLDPTRRVHLMIASQTGIAPFRSILRDALARPGGADRFALLHGARAAEELLYREELEALVARHPERLSYRSALVRDAAPRGGAGREEVDLVAALAPPALRDFDPAVTAVYACGSPHLIAAVRRTFCAAGFPVRAESWWKLGREARAGGHET